MLEVDSRSFCFVVFRDVTAGAMGGRSAGCQQNIRRAGAAINVPRALAHVMLSEGLSIKRRH